MFGLSVGALNSVDLVLLFLFIWWCIAWWLVVFAGLDVLIIVVSLAVFFVGNDCCLWLFGAGLAVFWVWVWALCFGFRVVLMLL